MRLTARESSPEKFGSLSSLRAWAVRPSLAVPGNGMQHRPPERWPRRSRPPLESRRRLQWQILRVVFLSDALLSTEFLRQRLQRKAFSETCSLWSDIRASLESESLH